MGIALIITGLFFIVRDVHSLDTTGGAVALVLGAVITFM
jgi:hypothetical protein